MNWTVSSFICFIETGYVDNWAIRSVVRNGLWWVRSWTLVQTRCLWLRICVIFLLLIRWGCWLIVLCITLWLVSNTSCCVDQLGCIDRYILRTRKVCQRRTRWDAHISGLTLVRQLTNRIISGILLNTCRILRDTLIQRWWAQWRLITASLV